METVCSGPKTKKTLQTVNRRELRGDGLVVVCGLISVLVKVHFHFCDVSIHAEGYAEILDQHVPSLMHPFQVSDNTIQSHFQHTSQRHNWQRRDYGAWTGTWTAAGTGS